MLINKLKFFFLTFNLYENLNAFVTFELILWRLFIFSKKGRKTKFYTENKQFL